MKYEIIYNGSKFGGQEPDDFNTFILRLRKYTLTESSRFKSLLKITNPPVAGFLFSGNFREISAVFRIHIYDKELIDEVKKLFLQSQRRYRNV